MPKLPRPTPLLLALALAAFPAGVALADEPPTLQVAPPAVPAPPASASAAPLPLAPAPAAPAPPASTPPAPEHPASVLPTIVHPPEGTIGEPPPPAPEEINAVVQTFEGGVAYVPGRSLGGIGRMLIRLQTRYGKSSGRLAAFVGGGEMWGGPRAIGGGFPVMYFGGYESPVVFGALGAGINFFTVDTIDGRTGGGLFSPRAGARLGVRLGTVVYLAIDGDVQYRWMWSIPNIALLSGSVSLGFSVFGK